MAVFNAPLLDSGLASQDREAFLNKPLSWDPDYVRLFLDFVRADEYNTTDWTYTKVDGDVDGSESNAVDAGTINGVLVSLNNDKDNDSNSLQLHTEAWQLVSGKKMWFDCRIKVSDADDCEFMVGLCKTDTTPLDVSDGIYFRVTESDASGNIDCKSVINSSSTSTSGQVSMVDDTFIRLSMLCDGTSSVKYYINKELVATHTTNLPTDEALCFTMHLANGGASAMSMSCDYLEVVKER